MSRLGSLFRVVGAAIVGSVLTGLQGFAFFASTVSGEAQRRKRDKANALARQRYNEAQVNRLEMVDLQPEAPRTLILGRQRHVEGIRRRWSSGANSEKLTLIVSFAGHEIDAFEQWYVDDAAVTLDGDGWVQQAPWMQAQPKQEQASGTLDSAGAATITLAHTPVGAVVAQWYTGSGDSYETGAASVSVSGLTATVTAGRPDAAVQVLYQRDVVAKHVRIRPYTGAGTQNVGAAIAAEYPGKITANDRFAGIALAVVDLVYSPDVFPQGIPTITAVMRGARCYDPRLDSTQPGGSGSHRAGTPSTWAWSDNPALLVGRYALWEGGLRLDATRVDWSDVARAAAACDVSTTFTLRKPDTSTQSVTLPRYRAGLAVPSDAERRETLDALCDAMAGEWAFPGAQLRLRAGELLSTATTIGPEWFALPDAGEGDEPFIEASNAVPRERRSNHVSGKCTDPSQRYQLLPYPAVRDATLIAAKGERRDTLELPAVVHIAHAQHLASIAIRRAQAGLQLRVTVGPQGDTLRLFDVVAVTLPDYGMSGKLFEVVGLRAHPDEPTQLVLRETSAAIYTPLAELRGIDPAPDSSLRAPWEVAQLGTLTVTSADADAIDGSVISRLRVTWPSVADEWVRAGGQIELQITRADVALPAGEWPSHVEPGSSTRADIPGLVAGRPYLVRGRMVQPLPLVRGPWRYAPVHVLAARPTVDTRGLASNAATEIVEFFDATGIAYSNLS